MIPRRHGHGIGRAPVTWVSAVSEAGSRFAGQLRARASPLPRRLGWWRDVRVGQEARWSAFSLRTHRLAVHEPRPEQRERHLLECLAHAPVLLGGVTGDPILASGMGYSGGARGGRAMSGSDRVGNEAGVLIKVLVHLCRRVAGLGL